MGIVFAVLTAVLVLLKLLGVIDISWWWVVVPALVPIVFVFTLVTSLLGLTIFLDQKK